jgi:hypothetical protein
MLKAAYQMARTILLVIFMLFLLLWNLTPISTEQIGD